MGEPLEVVDVVSALEGYDFVADLHVLSILVTPERGLLWAPVTDGVRSSAGGACSPECTMLVAGSMR